ncbi:MAG: ribonuclease HII [bacterium]
MKKTSKYLIGIDEAGRGPLAGPVSVGVFVFLKPEAKKFLGGARDSKKLSEEQREEWFGKIEEAEKAGLVDYSVCLSSSKIIDTKGISFAIRSALKNGLKKVSQKNSFLADECLVLLDGSLKAPEEYLNQKTIIKGDDKEQVISLASICAKVTRDRYMCHLAKKYPEYDFSIHKGYGTKAHYTALKKHGLSPEHRRTFLKKIL